MVCAPCELLPTGHSIGWDLEALALLERWLEGEIGIGLSIHDQVIGWDDEVPVHDDQVMADRNVDSPRNTQASKGTDVGVTVLGRLVT